MLAILSSGVALVVAVIVCFVSTMLISLSRIKISSHTGSNHCRPAAAYIVENRVSHSRVLPRESSHSFSYPTLFLLVSLNSLESHALDHGGGWLFGYGGISFRVTGLRSSGYLQENDCAGTTIKAKLKTLLMERGYENDEDILEDAWMLTMPAYLGFEGLNPLTVYFCYRSGDMTPWVIVLEIHNTFGERHAHVLKVGDKEDSVPVAGFQHQWTFSRGFHVSPFNDRSGSYTVSVTLPHHNPFPCLDQQTGDSSALLHPKVRVSLHDEESSPGDVGQVKLQATMRPTSVVALTSKNLSKALLRQPFVLFASLPRIIYQAWILHYRKHLPVYPRPEPLPTMSAVDEADSGAGTRSSGGIGWQSETWVQRWARIQMETLLKEQVHKLQISVTLVSGNPFIAPKHFASQASDQTLTISYLSPAFFTLVLEAPSAHHALLLGKVSKLFAPSSTDLFLLVFRNPSDDSIVERHHTSVSTTTVAQHLRLYSLPTYIHDHSALPVPRLHPLDSDTVCLQYLATLIFLTSRIWTKALEEKLYTFMRVRFVPGQEPWSQWILVNEYLTHAVTD